MEEEPPALAVTTSPKAGSAEPTWRGIPVAEAIEDYRLVCLAQAVDERELMIHRQGAAYFHVSGAGHEALLVGLARSLRAGYDWFFPYYRDLALVLALGVSPYDVLLQCVGAAADPASGGRQMSSHWGNPGLHIVTQSSATGSQCLPAIGCAEAGRYLAAHHLAGLESHADEVTFVSLGEGATSEGEFWESLNTACRLRLPVVYVVEDNGFAISVPVEDQAPAPISDLVSGFPGLEVVKLDGCDYFAIRALTAKAIARARFGAGPVLIHARVVRLHSHSSSDDQTKYRSAADIAAAHACDPVRRLRDELVEAGFLDSAAALAIREEAHALAAAASQEALRAAKPDPATSTEQLWELPELPQPPEPGADGEPVTFGEAIRLTLHEVMAGDERVRVFGQDVADAPDEKLAGLGGVFGLTHGLQRAFGDDRCYNTPLAEANIVGRGIGQAIRGLRPAAEVQFFDYIWTAMQQIRTEAATTRWRSNGSFRVPLVLRVAIGGYLRGGAIWHSQSGESIFTHIPGMIVMFPSRARDAAGLLRAAFRCEDPVLFLEHKHLFRQRAAMDPFPGSGYVVPPGVAATARAGRDLSLVTWGATVELSLAAAEQLATEGLELEVIDLRTLAPWDKEAVADSVARTARCLVVHEDVLTSGFGAEIAAFVASECFGDLDAPVRRVAARDAWVGYDPGLERAILPQVDDIVGAARLLATY
ncbi:MAG TPA: thiamine pyrophosphate-dependent enzyme [Acidimicrobiales bacterium]|nr:thiamine pyrophosphate-dependent enzyme [Acidimicrobiales bacterium]